MKKSNGLYWRYAQESNKYPVFSAEEAFTVCSEYYRTKSPVLLEKIFKHNVQLVLHIIRRYSCQLDDDFVSEGMIGLIYGIKKYNPHTGNKFSTYVSFWIKAFIFKHFEKHSYICKTGSRQAQLKLLYNLNKEIARLEGQGKEISSEIIAANLQVKAEDVESMKSFLQQSISIYSPIHGDGEELDAKLLIDTLPNDSLTPAQAAEDQEYAAVLEQLLNEFIQMLNPLEAKIFEWRLSPFREEKPSFRDIGHSLGISYEMVRLTQIKLQHRLKKFLQQKKLI